MKLIWAFGLLLSLKSHAFTTADLKTLIEEKNLRSVEDVLPHLPEDLRSNFTYQYKGLGLQAATETSPRVILFGKNGKFILTFNGHNEQRLGNELEILEFNDKSNRFELHHVAFNSGKVSYDQNLNTCLKCHTTYNDPHPFPIWGRYPSWRGSFGSLEDHVFGKELKPFQNLTAQTKTHQRYKYLLPPTGSEVSPYSSRKVQTVTFRPNSNMGSYLARLNAKNLAETIKQQKDFEKYLLLLSPSFFHCSKGLNKNKLSVLDSKLQKEFEKKKLTRPFIEKAFYELENLSAFLGTSSYSFGQHSYGKVIGDEIILQEAMTDPYYLDVFYLFTPNYVLAELSEPFFKRYPELKKDYDVISLLEKLGKNKRLNQTARDQEILRTMDELGKPLYLKTEKCQTFNGILSKEFAL